MVIRISYFVFKFESSGTQPDIISSSNSKHPQLWHFEHVVIMISKATNSGVRLERL